MGYFFCDYISYQKVDQYLVIIDERTEEYFFMNASAAEYILTLLKTQSHMKTIEKLVSLYVDVESEIILNDFNFLKKYLFSKSIMRRGRL